MRFYHCTQGQNDDDSVTQLKQSRDCLGKNSFMIDHVFESGEGRILNKRLYGEAPPGGPTPNPFYTNHFSQKRYSFRIPSIDK